jgi:hypothetical protein
MVMNKSRRMIWVEHIAYMGEMRNMYIILVKKKLERKRLLERIILRWILKERGCEDVDWIHLAQGKVQWQAIVNMITAFGLHKRFGIS